MVWIARWSAAGTGPATRPRTAGRAAKLRASAAALRRSAGVMPDCRWYISTAGLRFFELNLACRFSSWVEAALAGREADASFFSAPCSLPASDPVRATTTIQNTTTRYLVRLPQGSAAIRCALLLPVLVTTSSRARCCLPCPVDCRLYDPSPCRALSSNISTRLVRPASPAGSAAQCRRLAGQLRSPDNHPGAVAAEQVTREFDRQATAI